MAALSPPRKVAVVIGAGGMGLAVARRLANGRRLILADFSENALNTASKTLRGEGHDVEDQAVDVSDYASVLKLSQHAAAAGTIDAIIHTAGVSPAQATTMQILHVDLLGTANVLEAFVAVASPGTSLVCVASMAGHFATLSPGLEQHLAISPLATLLEHKEIDIDSHPGQAYMLAKRANLLRVQAMSRAWGAKGARVNTVSPGIISTTMGAQELEGESSAHIRQMIAISAARRVGTPDDVADAISFLAGPFSSFICGNDLLVDGGAVAAQRWITASMGAQAQQKND